MYMDVFVHAYAYVFYFQISSFNIHFLFILFFDAFLQNTECMLLIMHIGEVSISDSLLHPPLS